MSAKKDIKTRIIELIKTYKDVNLDATSINYLAEIRLDLATLNISFVIECAKKKTRFKELEHKLEVERVQRSIDNYRNKPNLELAKMYAKRSTAEKKEEVIKAENEWGEYQYLLKPINEILSELNQRIAHLREEMKQEQFLNATK